MLGPSEARATPEESRRTGGSLENLVCGAASPDCGMGSGWLSYPEDLPRQPASSGAATNTCGRVRTSGDDSDGGLRLCPRGRGRL